jgi:hypothetical protein
MGWSAVIKAGGGRVETDPSPRENPSPSGVPPVNLIAVPPLANRGRAELSTTRYRTGRIPAEHPSFRHPTAALDALRAIALYLLDNPVTRIELTGTTARWAVTPGTRPYPSIEQTP